MEEIFLKLSRFFLIHWSNSILFLPIFWGVGAGWTEGDKNPNNVKTNLNSSEM